MFEKNPTPPTQYHCTCTPNEQETCKFKSACDRNVIVATNDELPDPDFFDEDFVLDTNCPNCSRKYDEIDLEFQICHHCKYNNNPGSEDFQK